MNHFSSFHPLSLSVFYMTVLILTMATAHPVLLLTALVLSILHCGTGRRGARIWRDCGFYLFLFILIVGTSPLFSHSGETVLFSLNGKPVTAESFCYSGSVAVMIIAAVFWCKCLGSVFSSDKIIYLLGRVLPKAALLLSMALRFVPLLKRQFHEIQSAQKALGLYASDSMKDRLTGAFSVLGCLLTWAFENAVNVADSMRARGYGGKKRTNFSIYRFEVRDALLSAAGVGVCAVFFVGAAAGLFEFYYYPVLGSLRLTGAETILWFAAALFMALPSLIQVGGTLLWKYSRSKICTSDIPMERQF